LGTNRSLRILISPLDWGLGHTTRCVPLIAYMQQLGHVITFAGNEWQRAYITETFPGIDTIHIDGYEVHYPRQGWEFMLNLFRQIPRLLKTIKKEHAALMNITATRQFDAIISDNRYGLYHPTIPSVIMTHQLLAKSGMGAIFDDILRRIHYRRLQWYSQCWVIDVPGKPNLSGTLGNPRVIPDNAKFLGLLSQITPQQGTEQHLMILLSGPEPQRTILSEILWKQVQDHKGKVVFVEGSNNATKPQSIPTHISYYTRITKEQLEPLLVAASMVICRSGYSTVMDLVALGKKAIFIPTPGQTEQEYLGAHLHKEGVYYCAHQSHFNLQKALVGAAKFPYKKPALKNPMEQYKTVVKDWLDSL